jgi:hypothetical protein
MSPMIPADRTESAGEIGQALERPEAGGGPADRGGTVRDLQRKERR